jgi:hypothetical protein
MFEVNRTKNRRILFALVVGMLVWAGVLLRVQESPAHMNMIVGDQSLGVPEGFKKTLLVDCGLCTDISGGSQVPCHKTGPNANKYFCTNHPPGHTTCRSACQ